MTERSKRHHYVPQLHLRAFASNQARIMTFDRNDGHDFVQSVENAAVENHYNTTRTGSGTSSDKAETLISEFEGRWASALQRVREGDWLADPGIKVHLAHFIAFQYLRVPRQRSVTDQRATVITRLDLAAAGITATESCSLTASTQNQLLDELEVEFSTEQHLEIQFGLVQRLALMIEIGYHWSVVRWNRRALLTSDDPVVLVPAPDHPRWSGVGFATAGFIHLAIDRHTALVLTNRSDLGSSGYDDLRDHNSVPGSFSSARKLNQQTAHQATRFVFYHPDDQWRDLLGDSRILPRQQNQVPESEAMLALRRKVVAANVWASAHPDEEHPLSCLTSNVTPPSGARIFPMDGRSRRARDMQDRLERAEPSLDFGDMGSSNLS